MITCAKRLGREQLLAIVNGDPPSLDPDLQVPHCGPWVYCGVVDFLLSHAGELLQREDGEQLAQLLARERMRARLQNEGFQSRGVVTPFYAIGRARLAPQRASLILRAAFNDFPAEHEREEQAHLAGTLWQLCGKSEIPFLADWFLDSIPMHYGVDAQRVFLSYLSPGDVRFAERLLTDKRASGLDGLVVVAIHQRFPSISRALVLSWSFAQVSPARLPEPHKDGASYLRLLTIRDHAILRELIAVWTGYR